MIPHAPIDADTATLLDVIATDRVHEDDRAIVEAAVRQVARDHGGTVCPNALRAHLARQPRTPYPAVIGATVAAMKRRGELVHDGWVITEGSTSGNNGRPARRYRWTGKEAQ